MAEVGLVRDLVNSLRASEMGWGMPWRDTLLGPFRAWEYPKSFRSSNVKKAIAARARRIVSMVVVVNVIKVRLLGGVVLG